MNKKEELDLLLKELYQHRYDREFHSLMSAAKKLGIFFGPATVLLRANQLKKDLLIEMRPDLSCRITLNGISFCEVTSYAYKGHPIIIQIS
jgi:hypothetical protein